MTSLIDKLSKTRVEFSEEEIKKQLEALGYRNLPVTLLREFKRDLDQIVKEDLEKAKKFKEAQNAEPRSVYSGTLVQKTSTGQLVQTNFKQEVNDVVGAKSGDQFVLSKPTTHHTVSPVHKGVTSQRTVASKTENEQSDDSVTKEPNVPELQRKPVIPLPRTNLLPKFEQRATSDQASNAAAADLESRMQELRVNLQSLHDRARAEASEKPTSNKPGARVAQNSSPSESVNESNSHSSADSNRAENVWQPEFVDRRSKFCTVCRDEHDTKKQAARANVSSFSSARSTTGSVSSRSNGTRSSVIYAEAAKQRASAAFEKHDPVRRFASYRAEWSNAQSANAGLFGDGSHRQLRWTVRMMMKRVRDEAKEKERAAQVRRAATRQCSAVAYTHYSAPVDTSKDRKDRQLRWTVRNSMARQFVPSQRNQEQQFREQMHREYEVEEEEEDDDEFDSSLDDEPESEMPSFADRQGDGGIRSIEQMFQPYLNSQS